MKTNPLQQLTCLSCAHYSNYYINRDGCGFKKLSLGFCYKHLKQHKDYSSICDSFKNAIEFAAIRKEKLLANLEKTLNTINSIGEFLAMDIQKNE